MEREERKHPQSQGEQNKRWLQHAKFTEGVKRAVKKSRICTNRANLQAMTYGGAMHHCYKLLLFLQHGATVFDILSKDNYHIHSVRQCVCGIGKFSQWYGSCIPSNKGIK